MDPKHSSDFRTWIRDVKTEFGGRFPSSWPDSMVVLPYWMEGYSPKEFVEVWTITKREQEEL